ncbi:hypothetical protein RchiOBHm_Chr5g0054761 [Rosa chinensis]|uniref:Uncharacterized protein n=1 Tax=Rosa chinensis TaxID=74649 RepID=A0A2P6QG78_ROSCH|nr:hypothetical protein RchiOBHm_Chr5g0054761 [Rosa chinensis]
MSGTGTGFGSSTIPLATGEGLVVLTTAEVGAAGNGRDPPLQLVVAAAASTELFTPTEIASIRLKSRTKI